MGRIRNMNIDNSLLVIKQLQEKDILPEGDSIDKACDEIKELEKQLDSNNGGALIPSNLRQDEEENIS